MNQFTALGLDSELISALDDLNIQSPTEIQAKAIPQLLEYDPDFIGIAQTGTGKTASFLLPLLQLIDPSARETQALNHCTYTRISTANSFAAFAEI